MEIRTFEQEHKLIPLEASLVQYENNEPLSFEANPDCCPVCLAYGYYSDSVRTETILKAHWIAHMKYGWRPDTIPMVSHRYAYHRTNTAKARTTRNRNRKRTPESARAKHERAKIRERAEARRSALVETPYGLDRLDITPMSESARVWLHNNYYGPYWTPTPSLLWESPPKCRCHNEVG